MKVNREQIFEIAKEIINEHKIDQISNLYQYLPIDIRTFYKCFAVGTERYNLLMEMIKKNEEINVEN